MKSGFRQVLKCKDIKKLKINWQDHNNDKPPRVYRYFSHVNRMLRPLIGSSYSNTIDMILNME